MKKILYADLACPNGHVNYNRIMINSLEQVRDVDIEFFMQAGYAKKISETLSSNRIVHEVSSYSKSVIGFYNRVKYRIHQLKLQNKLYKLVKTNHYDLVFLSSFDIVAFLFFKNLPCKTLAVCHNEIDVAVNKKSVWLLRFFSKHCNLVSINKTGYAYLCSLGLKAYMIPHGFPQPFTPMDKEYCRQIYIPINGAVDWDIVNGLLTEEFNGLLKENKTKLIIKTKDQTLVEKYAHLSHILFLVGYIDDETYKKMMLNSSFILLPYVKEDYQYRCSAILMEAIINNKAVVLPNVPVFKELLQEGDNGLFFYDCLDSLISIIKNNDFDNNSVHYDNVKNLYSRERLTECFNSILYEQ